MSKARKSRKPSQSVCKMQARNWAKVMGYAKESLARTAASNTKYSAGAKKALAKLEAQERRSGRGPTVEEFCMIECAPAPHGQIGPWTTRAIALYRTLFAAAESATEIARTMPGTVADGVAEQKLADAANAAKEMAKDMVDRLLTFCEYEGLMH